jgi:hypothetical protein
VEQATIIVFPTGALLRESIEEFAKVPKPPRGTLAIHKRCIFDAAIQGTSEQWRQFGRKMALAQELRSLHPDHRPRYILPEENSEEGAGKKAANRPADPEATRPMVTRSKTSRAGSSRVQEKLEEMVDKMKSI